MSENNTSEGVAQTLQTAHERVHSVNPFMDRESYPTGSLRSYKILTAASWLLLVVTSIYYTFNAPTEGKHHRGTIWHQNSHRHTPFALNSIITSIYMIVLYILQVGYCWHLYSENEVYVKAAADVGSHFIFNNLLMFGFVHLWCRSHFWLAEMLIIINFFNLSALYFKHSRTPRFIHIPVVSGPLAINYVLLFTVGAAAVNAHSLPARILANIMIWSIMGYGFFFLVAYKDYTMGFNLSVLSAALGVAQFLTHVIAFQWIFAFVIMSVLFVLSVLVGFPGLIGQDPFKRGAVVDEDRERQPLLQEE
ncbi:ATP synthase F0 [Aureobasidium pullulans]|uniref:ATP synthase F0 n=1 Tax=Aureobasidium pullulans TaxID=5580 RepID=A0A1A7MTQ9_AURPU|nr:MAG: Dihydroxy-acid and 6-phosphogluconate dehydratase [Aureobasidium pullulans]THV73167.1 ATP synthase F0 [Aureobasidium pullulans]THV84123.1 ATP synthase F0 [Aureobasidium pullulans]THW06316.1 ATP synthase F0 [Aureobasidium pullulans]THW30298.1 ATP synthase F0 [Aureobasidium pullulans]